MNSVPESETKYGGDGGERGESEETMVRRCSAVAGASAKTPERDLYDSYPSWSERKSPATR